MQEEGLYCLEFTYRTEESLHSKISFSLLLDGAAPYDEWERLTLDRPYRYVPSGTEELFIKDDRGNDVQPQQELSDDKVIRNLYDADGKYNAPLAVYLTPGAHRLTMSFSQADVTLDGDAVSSPVGRRIPMRRYTPKRRRRERRIPPERKLSSRGRAFPGNPTPVSRAATTKAAPPPGLLRRR